MHPGQRIKLSLAAQEPCRFLDQRCLPAFVHQRSPQQQNLIAQNMQAGVFCVMGGGAAVKFGCHCTQWGQIKAKGQRHIRAATAGIAFAIGAVVTADNTAAHQMGQMAAQGTFGHAGQPPRKGGV